MREKYQSKREWPGVTLYHADCLDLLPIQADAVITDPPYGMNWDTDTTRFSGGKQMVSRGKAWENNIENDDKPFDPSPWLEYHDCVLFGCNHFGARLPVGIQLVWVKRNDHAFGSFLSDAEIAWMKGGYGVYCYRDVPIPTDKGFHPTQKPVPLMIWVMAQTGVSTGTTILDPFMGSGTTGIACIRTGRNFIGIEKDERYFKIACERIERELAQGQLFKPAEIVQPVQTAFA